MRLSTDKNNSGEYKSILVIFLFALGVRAFFLVWIDEPMLFGKYLYFAEKLAGNESIGERIADLSPFYLHFVTVFNLIFGDNWALLKWIHAMTGALNCLLLFVLGTRVFNKETGFLGALAYAAYGNLIVLETTLEPTVFVMLFNLLAVYFLQSAVDGTQPTFKVIAAGLFAGLSVITKPSFLLFLPMGAIWILVQRKGKLRLTQRMGEACLFGAAASLLILPVTVRNFIELNDVILVTADAGKVFYHGNSKRATALEWAKLPNEGFKEESAPEPDYAHVLFRRTASRLIGRPLSPSESSKFWMNMTFQDIADNPTGYFKRVLKKIVFFFTDYEMHFIAPAYKEYKSSLNYPFLRYGVIASLGITGMLLSAGFFKRQFLLYSVVFLYLISGMLFIVQSRYRTPAVPYLCLFAGYTLFLLKEWITGRNLRATAGACLAIAGLFYLSHFSFRSEILRADRWQQATKMYYEMGARSLFSSGRYHEAIGDLDRCILMVPNFSPAYNLRGKSLAIIGRNDAALEDFKRVITLAPNLPKGYKNAGYLYLLLKNKAMAAEYLEKALMLAPDDVKVAETLSSLR